MNSTNKPTLIYFALFLFQLGIVGLICESGKKHAFAQEKSAANPSLKSMTDEELRSAFNKAVDELRQAVKVIKRTGTMHFHVPSDEAYEYREQWEKAIVDGSQIIERINRTALEIFLREDEPDTSVASIVGMYTTRLYDSGELEVCSKLTRKLIDLFPDDPALKNDLARIAVATNDFKEAQEMVDYSRIKKYSKIEQILFENIDQLKANKLHEQKMVLVAEKATEPLPRVKIEIKDKGYFIIELFEDEAPETVANFIHLVEQKYYDGLIMHPVMSHLLAASGTGTMHETRTVDYTIYDEHRKPNRHFHLRGSVAMRTLEGLDNSGNSSFYVGRVPLPTLDLSDTVFGRVIEGMEIVDKITNTAKLNDKGEEEILESAVPDVIQKATVMRKRSHGNYKPTKVKEKQ